MQGASGIGSVKVPYIPIDKRQEASFMVMENKLKCFYSARIKKSKKSILSFVQQNVYYLVLP